MNRIHLQIPTYLVRNEGVTLTAMEFALLSVLKQEAFVTRNPQIAIDHLSLKATLDLHDGRTLKQGLNKLYTIGVTTEKVTSLPRRGSLTVTLIEESLHRKPFTRLPSKVLSYIHTIGHIGLRLLFYYESRIIRARLDKQFCFSAYKSICEELDISSVTLIKYNRILEETGLLTITRSGFNTDYSYETDGSLAFKRYNNHYTPNIEKM